MARTIGVLIVALLCAGSPWVHAAIEPDEEGKPARADESEPQEEFTEHVEVKARADDLTGIATSATEGVTGSSDLAKRPMLRSGEVVETVPGLIATQHSGGGKANQYFLRGFNLDHGTDFRVNVGGMQVNLPSHGHGQGYTDLNFVIPELVDTVEFRKGTYYADTGDFSAAGSTDIEYFRSMPETAIALTVGSFDFKRALLADSFAVGGGDLLGALEYYHYDGPWDRPDDFEKLNGVLRYSRGDAEGGFSVTAMGYRGGWDATDQIPERAVKQGLIGRFGLLDPDLYGESSRYSLSGELHRRRGQTQTDLLAYVISYRLELLSNFTYNLDSRPSDLNPVDGDQFLQLDDRIVVGAVLGQDRFIAWNGRPTRIGYGVELRYDVIENGLFSTSGGVATETVRDDSVDQWMAGAYVDGEVRWTPKVRTRMGLRFDHYLVSVEADLEANSGNRSDSLVSPKLGITFGPWGRTECYANFGYGYHSNDARGATIRVDPTTGEPVERVDPLVRARGADLGFRTTAAPDLQTSVSFFLLDMDSELLFVGDAGGTEASRPSRRVGVELTNFYRPLPWLSVDLDITLADAEFTDSDPSGNHIPGAIEQTVAAGVSFDRGRGWYGGLRWRYFGPRPLIEDGSVRSDATSVTHARVGYSFKKGVSLTLEVFNLFDREDNDIVYYYASRLPGEPGGGVEDIHFHPMESRTLRLTMRWRL